MELFTACCRNSQLLLKDDEHKKIVLQSLAFLCHDQRIRLYGYVILEDEFHVLWEKLPAWETKNIRQMMLKYTAQQIKHRLLRIRSPILEEYKSMLNDRHYHFWDKTTYFTLMRSSGMAAETINQMHEAPVATGLCSSPEEYPFSSAGFYHKKYRARAARLPDGYNTNIRDETAFRGNEGTPETGMREEASIQEVKGSRLHIVKNPDHRNETGAKRMKDINRTATLILITDSEEQATENGNETINSRAVSPGKRSVRLIYKSLTAGKKDGRRKSEDAGLSALLMRKTEEPLIITDFQTAFTPFYVVPAEE